VHAHATYAFIPSVHLCLSSSMSELSGRGSRKRRQASQVRVTSLERLLPKFDARLNVHSFPNFQNHLKQKTLFDHFLVTRKPTPVSTHPQRDDLRDEETGSQSVIKQTGAECGEGASALPELSSVEDVNDITHVDLSPSVSSTQSAGDVDIGALAIYPPLLP
jgi:hypothetical protein